MVPEPEPLDGGRGRRSPVVVSMLAIVVLLGAVALVASLVRHRAVPAEAEPSASASTSAAPVPTTAPATAPAGPWRVVRMGDRVTMATSFTDPGTNDTHRCDFAWDDGTTTSGPAQGDACRATHAYPAAGMYTVTSTVTDDDGGVGRAPGVLVVVYDPAAGPVRGSGRLGPGGAGAFDFVAGYPRRSATAPDGVLTFALPPTHALTRLVGEQVRDWDLKSAQDSSNGAQVLTVEFIKPLEKEYPLTLFSEQTVETSASTGSSSRRPAGSPSSGPRAAPPVTRSASCSTGTGRTGCGSSSGTVRHPRRDRCATTAVRVPPSISTRPTPRPSRRERSRHRCRVTGR